MVYVSVRGRVWLQAEAANMVEAVGNYVKHRRVPIMTKEVTKEGSKYVTFFVPALSGETVAHAYQVLLAEELKKLGAKVCKYCEKGIFLKSGSEEIFKAVTGKTVASKDQMEAIGEIERSIVENCGVEDVGGFLYAGTPNVKRTSNFLTGYMVPVKEVLEVISMEPQLHSRYALGTEFAQVAQMLYYVEVSSALFSFTFDLDTKYIGRYTFHVNKYHSPIVDKVEMDRRVRASLEALRRLLIEFPVGAKRTRFSPADLRWESIAVAVSDDVWTMPSSFTRDYLERAMKKRERVSYNTIIYAYAEEECRADKCYKTPEEAVIESLTDAMQRWAKELQQSR